jgi:hypothetical protein
VILKLPEASAFTALLVPASVTVALAIASPLSLLTTPETDLVWANAVMPKSIQIASTEANFLMFDVIYLVKK